MSKALSVFESRVDAAWVDYNGHLRDAFYGLVFSFAIDTFMDETGLDADYRARTRGTLYTAELHVFFLKEAKEGAPLRVETRLLDVDAKRLHLHQTLRHGDSGAVLAVQEALLLHVSQAEASPRSAPLPDAIGARLNALYEAQKALPPAAPRAGAIAIRRKA